MTDSERLDLSALDPARDPARWNALVAHTVERADAALRARREDPLLVLAAWARPLAAAAIVSFTALAAAEVLLEAREDRRERVERLIVLSTGWASSRAAPAGIDFVRALTSPASR